MSTYLPTCVGCGIDHAAGPDCPERPRHNVRGCGGPSCRGCDWEELEDGNETVVAQPLDMV